MESKHVNHSLNFQLPHSAELPTETTPSDSRRKSETGPPRLHRGQELIWTENAERMEIKKQHIELMRSECRWQRYANYQNREMLLLYHAVSIATFVLEFSTTVSSSIACGLCVLVRNYTGFANLTRDLEYKKPTTKNEQDRLELKMSPFRPFSFS